MFQPKAGTRSAPARPSLSSGRNHGEDGATLMSRCSSLGSLPHRKSIYSTYDSTVQGFSFRRLPEVLAETRLGPLRGVPIARGTMIACHFWLPRSPDPRSLQPPASELQPSLSRCLLAARPETLHRVSFLFWFAVTQTKMSQGSFFGASHG